MLNLPLPKKTLKTQHLNLNKYRMKEEFYFTDTRIIGTGRPLDSTTEEFKQFAATVAEHSKNRTPEQKRETTIFTIYLKIWNYMQQEKPEKIISAGEFLAMFLKELNIKNKSFAKYIGYEESNLSALCKGRRKINIDLALKLGKIFDMKPSTWLNIQSKNDLLKAEQENTNKYKDYKLADLFSETDLKKAV